MIVLMIRAHRRLVGRSTITVVRIRPSTFVSVACADVLGGAGHDTMGNPGTALP